jgi:hypothetical protein
MFCRLPNIFHIFHGVRLIFCRFFVEHKQVLLGLEALMKTVVAILNALLLNKPIRFYSNASNFTPNQILSQTSHLFAFECLSFFPKTSNPTKSPKLTLLLWVSGSVDQGRRQSHSGDSRTRHHQQRSTVSDAQ